MPIAFPVVRWLSIFRTVFVATLLYVSLPRQVPAQAILTPFQQAALAAFNTSGQALNGVTLHGTAVWTAGSLQESGSVDLTAAVDGSTKEVWTLPTQAHSLVETSLLSGKTCSMTDAKGSNTQDLTPNCFRPVAWFAPWVALNLLSNGSLIAAVDQTTASDLASGVTTLKYSSIFNTLSDAQSQAIAAETAPRLVVNVAYDTKTGLPLSIAYKQILDSDPKHTIDYAVVFADYRQDQGLMLAHRIQRYVQGSLQVDITVSSTTLN